MTKHDRRLPTPLVLVATSTMVSIGLLGMWASVGPDEVAEDTPSPAMTVDASTAERAAESFLDAWRKRAHDTAEALATGAALARVQERAARDAAMSDHERELKAQVWDAMARERLHLRLHEAANLEGDRLRLKGVAEGTFLGHPYSRAVEFVLHPDGHRWFVEDFAFGEILTETPGSLDLSDD